MKVRLHPCAVANCGRPVPRHLLMCMDHWRMVPAPLRREVTAAWKVVQASAREEGRPSLSATRNHQQICQQAAQAVVDKMAARQQDAEQILGDFFNQPSSPLGDELSKKEHGNTKQPGRGA